jgi:hypothetical protein
VATEGGGTARDFGNMLNQKPATGGKSPWAKMRQGDAPKKRKKTLGDYLNC